MSYAITPVATWTQVNREMAELGRMDGRELRDMGVSSCDFTAGIRQGTFERSSMLSAERIVFNPESTGEREADAERERMDFFVPFAPDPNWYCKWWLGDRRAVWCQGRVGIIRTAAGHALPPPPRPSRTPRAAQIRRDRSDARSRRFHRRRRRLAAERLGQRHRFAQRDVAGVLHDVMRLAAAELRASPIITASATISPPVASRLRRMRAAIDHHALGDGARVQQGAVGQHERLRQRQQSRPAMARWRARGPAPSRPASPAPAPARCAPPPARTPRRSDCASAAWWRTSRGRRRRAPHLGDLGLREQDDVGGDLGQAAAEQAEEADRSRRSRRGRRARARAARRGRVRRPGLHDGDALIAERGQRAGGAAELTSSTRAATGRAVRHARPAAAARSRISGRR